MNGMDVPGTCVVVYYHCVRQEERTRFARQMELVARHTVPVRADRAEPLPKNGRFACVTFDDAMMGLIENALPELEKRGIPATIFAVSGKLGQPPDWGNYSREPLTTELTMTASQLREIAGRTTIGSHTVSHPMLSTLSSIEAMGELEDSRKSLECLLNRKITLFSFPYGDFNNCLLKWASAAGYERVFTTLPATIETESLPSIVGRIRIDPTDWPLEFRLKILGAYRWLPAAFALKRKIRLLFNKRNKRPTINYDARREHGD